MAIDPRTDGKLYATEFFVEATSAEVQLLWQNHAEEARLMNEKKDPKWDGPRVLWKQDHAGFLLEVGGLAGHPVTVCFQFAWLNGHYVCFYEAASRVVDHEMVREYLKSRYEPRYDQGTRPAYTNAMNFHSCLNFCREGD